MLSYIAALILFLLALAAAELKKSYHRLPSRELRYQASRGDEMSKKLHRVAAYESSLVAFLWTVILLSTSGGFVILGSKHSLISLLIFIVWLWVIFIHLPKSKPGYINNLCIKYLTGPLAWLLNYLHPLIKALSTFSKDASSEESLSKIFDRKDILNLLEKLKDKPEVRVEPQDLEIAQKTLNLTDLKVRDIAVAWSKVKKISADEAIGPVLLDEIHKSQQQFIPVKDPSATKNIIGFMDMGRLDINATGKVSFYMDKTVYYLNEEDSLMEALRAFATTNYPALLVIDDHSRNVGLLELSGLIDQMLSIAEEKDVNFYTSSEAVATRYQPKEEI